MALVSSIPPRMLRGLAMGLTIPAMSIASPNPTHHYQSVYYILASAVRRRLTTNLISSPCLISIWDGAHKFQSPPHKMQPQSTLSYLIQASSCLPMTLIARTTE
jgi:hypothetical protein